MIAHRDDDSLLDGEILFGNGAYRVVIEHVKAAVLYRCQSKDHGFCVELLKCRGKQRLEIEGHQIHEGEETADLTEAIATAMVMEKKEDDTFEGYCRSYSWDYSNDIAPEGGGWKAKLCRLSLRLREVRTTVQGREWIFYFPGTLLFLLPNSKSFRVLQPVTEAEIEDEDDFGEDLLRWKRRLFLSIHWSREKRKARYTQNETTEGEADEGTKDPPPGDQEDKTGWTDYYRDLEASKSATTSKRIRKNNKLGRRANWKTRQTFFFYERESDGKPWYDNLLFYKYWEKCCMPRADKELRLPSTPRARNKPRIEVDEMASTIDKDVDAVSSLRVVDLTHEFSPRVAPSGEFILHATYTFTSPTKSSQLLSEIQALKYNFCPHITTEHKTRRKQPPRPLISELGSTRIYKDCCEFCWTEFEVEVQWPVVGMRFANKVIFRFWHLLGDGEGDVIWNAAKGVEIDGRAAFEKTGIRRRWENVVLKKWYED